MSSAATPRWPRSLGPELTDADLVKRALKVEVYHLNIGTGDSAIYYLIEENPKSWERPYVHRAVLIDGGFRSGAAVIREFLTRRVPLMFDFCIEQGGRKNLRFPPFDSIVITHWDGDHYEGVIELLAQDLIENYPAYENDMDGTDGDNEAERKTFLSNYMSPLLKYDNAASGQPRGNRAKTVIYAPYWGQIPIVGTSNHFSFPRGEGSYNGRFHPNLEALKAAGVGNPELDLPTSVCNADGSPMFLDWFAEKATQKRKADNVNYGWATKLCKIATGAKSLLGKNLFSNLGPAYHDAKQMVNPAALARGHDDQNWASSRKWDWQTSDKANPYLLLVSVNSECCGDGFPHRKAVDDEREAIQQFFLLPGPDAESDDDGEADKRAFTRNNAPRPSTKKGLFASSADHANESASPLTARPVTASMTGFVSPTPATPLVATATAKAMHKFPATEPASLNMTGKTEVTGHQDTGVRLIQTPYQPVSHYQSLIGGAIETQAPITLTIAADHIRPGQMKIIDKPLGLTDGGKMTNAASIMTMVVWTDGHVSHYAAGDVNWENEIKVVAWMWLGGNPHQTVRSVKLSHHGGASSTPTELLRQFRPRSLVASSNTNQFGHPRWEILLWLQSWFDSTNRVVQGLPFRPTAYAYYLAEADDGTFLGASSKITIDGLDTGGSAEIKRYQASLQAMANYTTNPLTDWPTRFGTEKARSNDPGTLAQWVMTETKAAWARLCKLDSQYLALTDATDAEGEPLRNQTNAVLWVCIECLSLDAKRRSFDTPGGALDGCGSTSYNVETHDQWMQKKVSKNANRFARAVYRETPQQFVERRAREIHQAADTTNRRGRSAVLAQAQQAQFTTLQAQATAHGQPIDPEAMKTTFLPKPTTATYTPIDFRKPKGGTKKLLKEVLRSSVALGHGSPATTRPTADEGGSGHTSAFDSSMASIAQPPMQSRTEKSSTVHIRSTTIPVTATGNFDIVPSALMAGLASSISNPILAVAPGTDFEVFVALLSRYIMTIDTTRRLVPDDELLLWLSAALSADDLTVAVSFQEALQADQVINIESLDMSMSVKLDSSNGRSPSACTMDFSTSAVSSNLAFDQSLYSSFQIPRSGFVVLNGMLILGLVKPTVPADAKWNFLDIMTFVGVLDKAVANVEATDNSVLELSTHFDGGEHFTLNKGTIWFMPNESNLLVQRLEWSMAQSDLATVTGWLSSWIPNLNIESCSIIGRLSRKYVPGTNDVSIEQSVEVMLKTVVRRTPTSTMTTVLDFDLQLGGGTVTVTLLPSDGTIENLIDWVSTLFGAGQAPSGMRDAIKQIPGESALKMRRIEVVAGKSTISRVGIDFEIVVSSWKDETGLPVMLWMTYTWTAAYEQPHGINAQVWFVGALHMNPSFTIATPPQLMPTYEETQSLRPSVPAASSIHLKSLMPGKFQLPEELDLTIIELQLSIENRTVSISGRLVSSATNAGDSNLGLRLEDVSLRASYTFAKSTDSSPGNPDPTQTDQASYAVALSAEIDLNGDPADDMNPATISIVVELLSQGNDKLCHLHGEILDLNMAILCRFLPEGDATVVKSLLGHLTLSGFAIDYNYDTQGKSRDFHVQAALLIGVVELDLDFTRDHDGWTFKAALHAVSGVKTNVGQIITAILNDNGSLSSKMPAFITDISLAGENARLTFSLASQSPPPPSSNPAPAGTSASSSKSYIVMDFSLNLGASGSTDFELSFMQIVEKPDLQRSNAQTTTPTKKRVIKAGISNLPWHALPNPPVVDQILPPFDELEFYWVQDPVNIQGLTRLEITHLSAVAAIQFKDTVPAAKQSDTDVVLPAGMHFMVADSGGQTGTPSVLLDYLFNKPKALVTPATPKTPATRNKALLASSEDSSDAAPVDSPNGTGTAMGKMEKNIGPIKVSNVGIRYENNELILYLDALVHLGPIEFDLIGLGMGLNLAGISLSKLSTLVPKLHIAGAGISFEQPPVGIAGLFLDQSTPGHPSYVGGVSLTMEPYSFMAIGAYGEVEKSDKSGTFKSVFIFAKLNGPLIELEFVTVTGITLGFGYNSSLRIPTLDDVPTFPFIANSQGGEADQPLDIMLSLAAKSPGQGWITPQESSLWLAAGLEAKLFQAIDVSAVVVIEFNPYVSLGIFAKAIAQMPPAPTDRKACFIYVELGLLATVDFHAGALRIEAVLSPNSFVIHPSCHLTGGFGLCYWFGASPFAGDFVFTIGGYHAAYKPPAHYPVPQRLAISWDLGGGLSVTGQAYFAITPKCCMGGGLLNAVLDAGPLSAFFSAHADFLIVFSPFYFTADIGVCVGVRFTLDLLFVTIHISVDIGADLSLQGPPFGGVAHVDFWVFGFDVPFGNRTNRPDPIPLSKFHELLLEIPDGDAPDDDLPTVDKLHVLSVESGRFTDKAKSTETKQGEIWEVKRGDFVFRVQARLPLQKIDEEGYTDADALAITDPITQDFYAKPMQLATQLISTMTVKIVKLVEQHDPVTGKTIEIEERVREFRVSPIVKAVPLALWGPYNSDTDPSGGNNNIDSLMDSSTSGTKNLMMGATFTSPPPYYSLDKILAYDALAAHSIDVFTDADEAADPGLPPHLPSSVTYIRLDWASSQPLSPTTADPAAQWEAVMKVWNPPSPKPATSKVIAPGPVPQKPTNMPVVENVIANWSKALGWAYSTDTAQASSTMQLKSVRPEMLWNQFQSLYLASPLMGVVS